MDKKSEDKFSYCGICCYINLEDFLPEKASLYKYT